VGSFKTGRASLLLIMNRDDTGRARPALESREPCADPSRIKALK
jgi:hypothetical protein